MMLPRSLTERRVHVSDQCQQDQDMDVFDVVMLTNSILTAQTMRSIQSNLSKTVHFVGSQSQALIAIWIGSSGACFFLLFCFS